MLDIDDSKLASLSADFSGFLRIGMEYADSVLVSDENFSDNIKALFSQFQQVKQLSAVEVDANYLDTHYNLYTELAG